MNNLNNNQEEYISLLTYAKGNLLLEGKTIVEYANMHPESIGSFIKYIEIILISKKYDNYQIIKTENHDSGNYFTTFELKAKASIYEQLRKEIFYFAYTFCSNVVEENEVKYWTNKEWDMKNCVLKCMTLYNKHNLYAILPSKNKGYNIRIAYNKKVNEEERLDAYQRFLNGELKKPITKKLKRDNN